jgi:hypothetical protein
LYRFQRSGTTINQIDFNGDQTIQGSLILGTAGNKLRITTGANASAGTATLVAGTITIATTAVTAVSLIMITVQEAGILTGVVRVSARVAATNFTITSSIATDTATVAWFIIN